MSYLQPNPPDQKTTEAAVLLGETVRNERGRYGLRGYLSMLAESFPQDWVREVARRLDQPCPPAPPPPPPFDPLRQDDPMRPLPQEPRQKKPDMDKILQLMQLMGNLKS
jgi:hypothetical protein